MVPQHGPLVPPHGQRLTRAAISCVRAYVRLWLADLVLGWLLLGRGRGFIPARGHRANRCPDGETTTPTRWIWSVEC